MKYCSTLFLLLFFLKVTYGQESFSGTYKLGTTGDVKDISVGTILKLNCNKTFVQEDTVAVGYGKWSVKSNNQLTLEFDSIAENGRMDITKTRIKYLIEDGRIFRKTIPKKEYKKFTNSIAGYYSG